MFLRINNHKKLKLKLEQRTLLRCVEVKARADLAFDLGLVDPKEDH